MKIAEFKVVGYYNGILKNYKIEVTKETRLYYYGIWESPFGSLKVKIPKDNCIKIL